MHSAIWPKDIFSCLNFAAPNCQVTDFDITSGLQCTITTVIITCVACIHHAPTPPDANLNWHGTAEVIARTSPACPPVWYPPPPVSKNHLAQEPTPGSAVEFWCARTNPWFRGRTLPVPGHGGGGGVLACWQCPQRQMAETKAVPTSPKPGPAAEVACLHGHTQGGWGQQVARGPGGVGMCHGGHRGGAPGLHRVAQLHVNSRGASTHGVSRAWFPRHDLG